MKKFECRGCENHCVLTTNDNHCSVMCHLVYEDWHEVKEETVTDCNQLPKLTAEVFDRPDCPDWAKYAFINGWGICILLEEKPNFDDNGCNSIGLKEKHMHEWGSFECVRGEYVERPAKALPDWCKVEKHGFDNEQKRYFEIVHIDEKWVDIEYLDDGNGETACRSDMQKCSKAKKRPFNDKEMKNLVGNIAINLDGDVSMITDYDCFTKELRICGEVYSPNELFCTSWQIDGKPCYVLEHLENGEWVE